MPDVHLDITKVLHPRIFGYLAPLMPGLFFEISMLLSGSHGFRDLSSSAQLGYYTALVVALIVAFIVGIGFMLLVRVIQFAMAVLYRLAIFIRKKVAERLQNLIGRLLSQPQQLPRENAEKHLPQFKSWLARLRGRLQMFIPPEVIPIPEAWLDAAGKLLDECYGIKPHPSTKWDVWYEVLGTPAPEYMRGHLTVVASEATGWCGLVAARLSPALRNRYYLGFSLLLVLYGLWADWLIASRVHNLTTNAFIRLHGVLRELKEVRMKNRGTEKTPEDQDER